MEVPDACLLMLDSVGMGEPTKYTMLNEVWWDAYTDAVRRLKENPEKYTYSESAVLKGISSVLNTYSEQCDKRSDYIYSGSIIEGQLDYLKNVYVNQSEDVYLRAYYYANSVVSAQLNNGKPSDLSKYVVVFQDWSQSQRGYTVFFGEAGYACDSDYMVDLEVCYEYLMETEQ